MEVRVIVTRYTETRGEGDLSERIRHGWGEVIDVPDAEAERGLEAGFFSLPDEPAPNTADSPNAQAAPNLATEPGGEPVKLAADGGDPDDDSGETPEGDVVPLDAAGAPGGVDLADWKAPRTHKAADAELAELNLAAPQGATVSQKAEMIRSYREASAAGAGVAAAAQAELEALHELSDPELIERGVEFGLTEDELVEKGHDELVEVVATQMNRITANPAAQADTIRNAGQE